MGNCRASLSTSHFVIDIKDRKKVRESLYDIMAQDNDLTENEDYFQDDTLELGYESEADRIVKEYIKENGFPRSIKAYVKAFEHVFTFMSRQEYFGDCETDFINLGDGKLSICQVMGGDYGN